MYSRKIGDRKRGKAPLKLTKAIEMVEVGERVWYEVNEPAPYTGLWKPWDYPSYIDGVWLQNRWVAYDAPRVVARGTWRHPDGTIQEYSRCMKRGCSTCRDYDKSRREAKLRADAKFDLESGLQAMYEEQENKAKWIAWAEGHFCTGEDGEDVVDVHATIGYLSDDAYLEAQLLGV